MANGPAIAIGIFFLFLAGLGYIYPVGSDGQTIPQFNDMCKSGIGQLGQLFSSDAQENCRIANYMTLGVYGFGIIGVILIIVGAVVPSKRNEYLCKNCNFRTDDRREIEDHCDSKHERGDYYLRKI